MSRGIPVHRGRGGYRLPTTGCIFMAGSPTPLGEGRVRHTFPMSRRSVLVVLVLIASIALLTECGTSPVAVTAPKSACSLMTANEAAAIFPIGTHVLGNPPPAGGSQSYCYYGSPGASVMLQSDLSWSTKEIAGFSRIHAHVASGTPLPAGAITAADFTKLVINGTDAYWLAHTAFPIGGTSTYPAQMSALKEGYLVILTSTGLTQTQNEQAMRTILHRL